MFASHTFIPPQADDSAAAPSRQRYHGILLLVDGPTSSTCRLPNRPDISQGTVGSFDIYSFSTREGRRDRSWRRRSTPWSAGGPLTTWFHSVQYSRSLAAVQP